MDVGDLSPVERTTLLTEYARAVDARQPRPILGDPLADEVVRKIDYDYSTLGVTPSVRCLVALRARMLDDRVRAFVAAHPDAVVVDLGSGLSSMVYRVDPPGSVDWYSVDLPGVLALRSALLPPRTGSHTVAASVAEPGWCDAIPAHRPTMAVADGLFAFLTEPAIVSLLRRITGHFDSGAVAFNDYGRVSKLNRITGQLAMRGSNSPHLQWNFAGFKDPRQPERWNSDLRLVEEASAMFEPETEQFPRGLRAASRLARRVPAIARKARILRFEFARS
ncbi:GlcNAc transferase [Mycolicibacterium duvalii]|uniref:Putative O-methyltransferase Omt n=1 Tax=Mycolicibacterium duvalii TaxID=39688 RepID=A0A7I7JX65_9MYCO|nr:class I SAM-dependent methyltransferase [Mycolicibacterium duvalii]MCV7369703.1 class I SAM-dependent methyltransferase [Mycolicibacterium duvalii]PEG38011.1 GlcNAc transferase [Mycolicibacterium duvalii]BBX16430.1 putative O-methyltransferase Omt [Mycolicibacterium duvalii]